MFEVLCTHCSNGRKWRGRDYSLVSCSTYRTSAP
jgi:hypothetical protein